jgi:phosphatidyl-myo-inositol dimannoside synthase
MKIRDKLILISSEFPPLPGGIGNHAYNLTKYLISSGYTIEVVTPFRSKNIENEINYDKGLNFKVYRYQKKIKNYIILFFKLLKKGNVNPRSTFIASGMIPLIICGLYKFFFNKNKTILFAHGSDINTKNFFFKIFVSFTINYFDLIIVNSNYTSKIIQRNHKKRSTVINNGIDLKLFKKISDFDKTKVLNLNKLKIVTVGTISERKGQKNIIEILPELIKKYKNITYHMIGLPKDSGCIMKLAKKKNVVDNIFIHGALSNIEMIKVLKSTDIFMMLSEKTSNGEYEGFGIAVIEANYLGIPAIGSKACGLSDSIINGKTGFLVNPKNKKEILSSFNSIIKQYGNFSKASKIHAEKYSWDNVIIKYIEILRNKNVL